MKVFKSEENQQNYQKHSTQLVLNPQRTSKSPIKSFRSKLFEKRTLKSVPKVNKKQIFLHSPIYQQYLSEQFKLSDEIKNPQIWGCIITPPRKTKSVRQNFLKRNINTPQNIYKTYIKRKNKLIYGVPLFGQQLSEYNGNNRKPGDGSERDQNNNSKEKFFHKIQRFNQTQREKVKRYDEEEFQDINSKFFVTKPQISHKTRGQTHRYSSEFDKKISKADQFSFSQEISRLNNKSIYKMSLQQLKSSVRWRKKFLDCLNQSMKQTKAKYF